MPVPAGGDGHCDATQAKGPRGRGGPGNVRGVDRVVGHKWGIIDFITNSYNVFVKIERELGG